MFTKLEVNGHDHDRGGTTLDNEFGLARYSSILGNMLGIRRVVNRAANNAGYAAIAAGVSVPTQTFLTRTRRVAPFVPDSSLVVLGGAWRDCIMHGQPTATVALAFKHGLRAAIARSRACEVFDCDDAGLTYSGSWGASVTATGFSANKLKPAGANGDYVQVAVPADWPGGKGVLGCEGLDTSNGAVFTVTVDGVTKGTLDTRSQAKTGTTTPATLRFDVPAGAALIRATVSNFATSARFNYLALETPSAGGHASSGASSWNGAYTPPLVLVCLAARPNSWGATGLNDGVMQAYWTHQLAVCQEFASPLVQAVDLDGVLGKLATMFQSSDTVAPNRVGHIRIASALALAARFSGLGTIDHAMLGMPATLDLRAPVGDAKASWWDHQDSPVGQIDSAGNVKAPQIVSTGTYVQSATDVYADGGEVHVRGAGRGLRVKEGTNCKQGVATLVGGTVVVSNSAVTATSRIILTAQDNNSTGSLRVSARTAGTSFTITSDNAGDSGVVAYQIFEPA